VFSSYDVVEWAPYLGETRAWIGDATWKPLDRATVSAFGTGYTARMRKIIAAVVFVVIALWLGIYVVPDLIANMLPGEP
jgi:hypothetical protein